MWSYASAWTQLAKVRKEKVVDQEGLEERTKMDPCSQPLVRGFENVDPQKWEHLPISSDGFVPV